MPITRRKVITYALGLLAAVVVAMVAYITIALNWSYSSGERAGFLQKISQKGWVCKTWEGELTLVSIPGTTPEKFIFTVRDKEVAQRINDAVGKKVALSYEQHKGIPSTCFGDTEYFVVGVRELPQ